MKYSIFTIIIMATLSACFPGGGFFEQAQLSSDATQAISVQTVGETTVAQVYTGANITQTMTVPEGSPLEGTGLSIPPGALNVSMTISIEEAVTPATDSSLGALGIASAETDSIATVFSNDAGVTSFAEGTAGTIQVSTGKSTTSLALTSSTTRVMFSRTDRPNGSCVDTIYQLAAEDFLVLASGTEVAVLTTPYFGTYQVISIPATEFPEAPVTNEWGATILAEVVPEECRIVTKTEKKVLDQQNPISLGALTSALQGQKLTVSAPKISETPSKCSFSVIGANGVTLKKDSTSAAVLVDLKGLGFPLNGAPKFQCTFPDGRFLSEEAVPNLPAGIRAEVDTGIRQAYLRSDLDPSGTCVMEAFKVSEPNDGVTEPVSDPSLHVLDFANDIDAAEIFARLKCNYADNSTRMTPYVRFAFDACSACAQDTSPPSLSNINWPSDVSSPGSATVQITATDSGTGIRELCFGMRNRDNGGGDFFVDCADLIPGSGDKYTAQINLADYYPVATYDIAWIEVSDFASNRLMLHSHNGSSQYSLSEDINNGTHNYLGASPYAVFTWTITAGAGHTPDATPPVLSSLGSIPATINIPYEMQISYSATDTGGSYIGGNEWESLSLCIEYRNKVTQNLRHDCPWVKSQGGGNFVAQTYLDSSLEGGDWFFERLTLTDMAGNSSVYNAPTTLPGDYIEAIEDPIAVPEFTIANGQDNTPPDITGGEISLSTISPDVSSQAVNLGVTVPVVDASPISEMCIWIDDDMSPTYELFLGCKMPINNGDGTMTGSFLLDTYLNPKTYAITAIKVKDNNNNYNELYRTSGSDSQYSLHGNLTSVDVATFTLSNGTPDTIAPLITSITLDKTTYNVPDNMKISVNITESGSGIGAGSEACVDIDSSAMERGLITHCAPLADMGTGNYEFMFPLDQWLENAVYKVMGFTIHDRAGNWGSMFANSFTNTSYDNGVTVVGATIAGATLDNMGPTLASTPPVFSATSYNPGQMGAYVDFYIDDAISGVRMEQNYPCWRLVDTTNPTDFIIYLCGPLMHMGGNQWRMYFDIPGSQPPGAYFLESMDIFDRAGNGTAYYASGAGGTYSPDPEWTAPSITINNP